MRNSICIVNKQLRLESEREPRIGTMSRSAVECDLRGASAWLFVDRLCLRRDVGGDRHEFADDLFRILTGNRMDRKLLLRHVGEKPGSFMVSSNALRTMARRSAGTCFDMMNGRPTSSPPSSRRNSCRCSSLVAKLPI